MKKLVHIYLVHTLSLSLSLSQNLVPNPSFEDTIVCPSSLNQVYNSESWTSFGGTPDYFNSCDQSLTVGVPINGFGYQWPDDTTGKGYCGIYTLIWGFPNYREFIGTQLNETLVAGQSYYVSFKVNWAGYNCATNGIGVRFTNVAYSEFSPAPTDNTVHVVSDSIITDTLNWVNITGKFVADSVYNYIVVGSFYDYQTIDSTLLNGTTTCDGAYYYIDNICVSTDSMTCNSNVALPETYLKDVIKIYPNPTKEEVFIEINGKEKLEVLMYNSTGQLVIQKNIFPTINNKLNLSNLQTGVYFLHLTTEQSTITKKIIINP